MRRFGIALTLLVVGASCGGASKDAQGPRLRKTAKDIVNESSDGIVRVAAVPFRDPDKRNDKERELETQFGTGFVVDPSGLVATNLHVVVGAADIRITLHDRTVYKVVEIASIDPLRDLAVVRVKPAKPLKALRLGDSVKMEAGDPVTAIGNPLGVFDYSVSSGLLSAVREACEKSDPRCPPGGISVLQITAPISQGSSGGPLFNQFGEVIGVTTAIVTQGQAINLAVPGDYLKPLVAKPEAIALVEFARATGDPSGGAGATDEDGIRISRQIPDHPDAVLEGCSDQQVKDLVVAIGDAIEIGAPLYNQKSPKGMEACFRVYEGTANKLEQQPPCKGVGKAFGDGLLRASTMASYKEKAWALRDTFDGLLRVTARKIKP